MAWEREVGQSFTVDVRLGMDLGPAGRSDSLHATVNYGEVFARVRSRVEGPPVRLIETVAEGIAEDLLGAYPQVVSVEVRVKKPQAPVGGPIAYAAVEIVRTRSGSGAEERPPAAQAETDERPGPRSPGAEEL